MDSNHRYRIRNNPFGCPRSVPAIRLPQQKTALSCRGPMVRIHLPPAASQQRTGPPAEASVSSGFIERVKLQIEVLILKMRRNGELPSDHTQIGNDITHQIVSGSLLLERRGDSGFSHGRLFGCE